MDKEKAQKLFEKAVRGVIAQGAPAWIHGSCKYRTVWPRTSETRSCALGMLIDDRDYSIRMEGSTPVGDGIAALRIRKAVWGRENLDFNELWLLTSLQGAHDEAVVDNPMDDEFIKEFIVKTRAVAETFGLKFPEDI